MKRLKQSAKLLLALILLAGTLMPAVRALTTQKLDRAIADTVQYLTSTVKTPSVAGIGGEWTVIGLARSGCAVPDGYFQGYYDRAADYITEHGGVLHAKKHTENSRVILALSALGLDARNVGGCDLTAPLGNFDQTIYQGINGAIWALIALDSRSYPMPAGTATRQKYVDHLLAKQLSDGGWSLSGTISDPDMTAMALQALAKYRSQSKVSRAVQKGLACLSQSQDSSGGFSTYGTAAAESCAQVLVALCELGIGLEDSRFVKNQNTVLDALMDYYLPGSGFCHTKGSKTDLMATEQALYALVAAKRAQNAQSSLYSMTDAAALSDESAATGYGLPGKHADVTTRPVTKPDATFSDIKNHPNQSAIEALARHGIVSGRGNGKFFPDDTLTRAEFAAMSVNALGLPQKQTTAFSDVKRGDWFFGYAGSVCHYQIAGGKGNGIFDPNGTITRQEGAVMAARAAALCGMDTDMTAAGIRHALAGFSDYVKAADWSRSSLAFCYNNGILDADALTIQPAQTLSRGEAAQMFYVLLDRANLL